MKFKGYFNSALALCACLYASQSAFSAEPKAPPPNEPPLKGEDSARAFSAQAAAEPSLYSIGDPTAEEQQYLEYINRARANPAEEGLRLAQTADPEVLEAYGFFNVDLTKLVEQLSAIEPAPPLAFNQKLIQAARGHSADMFENVFQSHDSSNGNKLRDRLAAVGYSYSTANENVYSYADSVFYGHAGFEVDWGVGEYGMQTPPGHRNAIHNPALREVGIGVVLGSNSSATETVGPQVVTQDFGVQQGATPIISGVAFYDVNGNSFYDLNEGIGGVSVSVNGQLRAITALSGGYAVPVPGSGTYTVTFAGGGFVPVEKSAVVQFGQNVKVDFTPSYDAPVLLGQTNPGTNVVNVYTVSPFPGAALFEVRKFDKVTPRLEGGEAGLDQVIVSSIPYEILSGLIKKSGLASYHFAHPVLAGAVVKPSVTLRAKYLVKAGTKLTYQSRFAQATADQKAVVQVSSDSGSTWKTVESRSGSGGVGEAIFTLREVNLGEFAGQEIQVRFIYETNPGAISIYPVADEGFGWYVDDIQLVNADEIANDSIQPLAGDTFEFQPTTLGDFSLQVRARVGHYFLPWGPARTVRSVAEALEFDIVSIQSTGGNFVHVEFEVTAGSAPAGFTLQGKSAVEGSWSDEPIAVQSVTSTRFRYVVPKNLDANRFFRVKAN